MSSTIAPRTTSDEIEAFLAMARNSDSPYVLAHAAIGTSCDLELEEIEPLLDGINLRNQAIRHLQQERNRDNFDELISEEEVREMMQLLEWLIDESDGPQCPTRSRARANATQLVNVSPTIFGMATP